MTTEVSLGSPEQAFARGGNRLCYVDPRDAGRCIKVLLPERSPAIRRAQKSFPKNLLPLSRFDDNLEEFEVMQKIDQQIGEPAFFLISRCYGFVQTNRGAGLCSELIRDANGLISITIKQYIWEHGVTPELSFALDEFSKRWQQEGIPSRDLLLHNIVAQRDGKTIARLVVIDGLGWAGLSQLAYKVRVLARRTASRKIRSLYKAIDLLIDKKSNHLDYGYHGWLTDDKRTPNS